MNVVGTVRYKIAEKSPASLKEKDNEQIMEIDQYQVKVYEKEKDDEKQSWYSFS